MIRRVVLCLLVCLITSFIDWRRLSADEVARSESTPIELLFLAGERPSRLALTVTLDGQLIDEMWNETFRRLFYILDRDGNQSLDEAEAGRLPASFTVRQIAWGRFAPPSARTLKLSDLDFDANGVVSSDEMRTYYRRAGLGRVLVGVGKTSAIGLLTDALLKSLDGNQDGQVDGAEWKSARDLIDRLDANDDERINPQELVAQVTYPGAVGSLFLRPTRSGETPDPLIAELPFVLVPPWDSPEQWAAEFAGKVDAKQRNSFDDQQIITALTDPPAWTWSVSIASSHDAASSSPTKDRAASSTSQHQCDAGLVRFILRSDEGKLSAQTVEMKKTFESLFIECDTNSDGCVDQPELAAPRSRTLKPIAAIADRDSDEILTRVEFDEWLTLWTQLAKGQVLLTIVDHGCGLFEFLDGDHDGALSSRELRTAYDRLREAGCFDDEKLDRTRLPRHLLAVISHGHPVSPLGQPARRGPDWFLAMDRNQDGDVSRTEFAGTKSQFKKLDQNRDGFLDSEEVEQQP